MDKFALVTGGGLGIGRATALKLAAHIVRRDGRSPVTTKASPAAMNGSVA